MTNEAANTGSIRNRIHNSTQIQQLLIMWIIISYLIVIPTELLLFDIPAGTGHLWIGSGIGFTMAVWFEGGSE